MHDDFPQGGRPFLVTLGILLSAFALAAVMLIYTSIRAEAQQAPLCVPASVLLPQWAEIHKERPVWGGVVPSDAGPIEMILLQSDKENWTLITIRGGIACVIAAGSDATPIETGKGV